MKDFILIPTYNEKDNIAELVKKIFDIMPEVWILVVDDNSPDGTAEIIQRLKIDFPNLDLLLRSKKEGLGKAYVDAFGRVLKNNDIRRVVIMDGDLSHDPEYLREHFRMSNQFDVVIGSRYVSGGKTVGWELWRMLLSRFASFYCKLVTKMPIHDCTSGFMTVDSSFLRKIDFSSIDLSGYAFLIELKYVLWQNGASITEIPITFKNRVGGESKISNHIITEGILAPWKMKFKKRT